MNTTIDEQINAVKSLSYASPSIRKDALNDALASLSVLKLIPKPQPFSMDSATVAILEAIMDGNEVRFWVDNSQNVRLEVLRKLTGNKVQVVIDSLSLQGLHNTISEVTTMLNQTK